MTFQKGQSGNPNGRPKEIGELTRLARSMVPGVFEILYRIAGDESEKVMARVRACELILDRSGVPKSVSETPTGGITIEGSVVPTGRVQLEEFLKMQLMKESKNG